MFGKRTAHSPASHANDMFGRDYGIHHPEEVGRDGDFALRS